jgi:hypothetical protein
VDGASCYFGPGQSICLFSSLARLVRGRHGPLRQTCPCFMYGQHSIWPNLCCCNWETDTVNSGCLKVEGNLDPVLNVNKKKRRYRWVTHVITLFICKCFTGLSLCPACGSGGGGGGGGYMCIWYESTTLSFRRHLFQPTLMTHATLIGDYTNRQYMNRKGGFNRLLANQQ